MDENSNLGKENLSNSDKILTPVTEKIDSAQQEKLIEVADQFTLLEGKFGDSLDKNQSLMSTDLKEFDIGKSYSDNTQNDLLNFLKSESVNNFGLEYKEQAEKHGVNQFEELSESDKQTKDLSKDWTATIEHNVSGQKKDETRDLKSNVTNMLIDAEKNGHKVEIKKEPSDLKEHDENVTVTEFKDKIEKPEPTVVGTVVEFEDQKVKEASVKLNDDKIFAAEHQKIPVPDDVGHKFENPVAKNGSEEINLNGAHIKNPVTDKLDLDKKNVPNKQENTLEEQKKDVDKVKNTSDENKKTVDKQINIIDEKKEEMIAAKEHKEKKSEDVSEIGPKELFSKYGLMEAIIYWRDPKVSGIVFGSTLVVLLSLAYFSLISVVANLGLSVLASTIGFRIYKEVLQIIQKTPQVHPLHFLLSRDITLPQEKVHEIIDNVLVHINACIGELRRLFLVENLVDSIKFGVVLWILTYVGAWFNGLTLVIIGFIGLFSLPKIYENNKVQIDQNIKLAQLKVDEFTNKIKEALPVPLRRRLPEKTE